MQRAIIAALLIGSLFGGVVSPVSASGTWCGVYDHSRDRFLNLRAAPSSSYRVTGRVEKSDFLFIDTSRCRGDFADGSAEFGKSICAKTDHWVFVESVVSRDGRQSSIKGWANARFIREVGCPE